MVTRGECFWVACNRLIISFFVFMLFGREKGGVRRESCMPQVYRPSPIRGVHGLMATRLYPLLYKGYISLLKLVVSI